MSETKRAERVGEDWGDRALVSPLCCAIRLRIYIFFSVCFPRDGEKKKVSVKRKVTEYSSDTEMQGPLPKKRRKKKSKS